MQILNVVTQLRTTDLVASIRFYTMTLGLMLEFQHEDFYAGIRAGSQVLHLKLSDDHLYFGTDDVAGTAAGLQRKGVPLVKEVHDTSWGTREFAIRDDQGHTLYFGERL